MSCNQQTESTYLATLMTADPGHFHASLVQKEMYEEVNPESFLFAPEGPEVADYLNRINGFNGRDVHPTSWTINAYVGFGFFEKLLSEKPGNVLVLAGNNQKKTEYIKLAVDEGIHVFSDKPMAINSDDFELLKYAFASAEKNGVLLYDIMTERFEITSMLQKELANSLEIFGEFEKGTVNDPAVIKQSVHHFFKYISGSKIQRPPWFFDVNQEGDGIVDVTTHLVDLIQWACYPEQILDYEKDIEMLAARRWATLLDGDQYREVTGLNEYPNYLRKDLDQDSVLHVFSNGEMIYKLKDIVAKVSVEWKYRAPEGTGDTHFSLMRGTKSRLEIRQGLAEDFVPELYVIPVGEHPVKEFKALDEWAARMQPSYPGVSYEQIEEGYRIVIPAELRIGHEAHFAQVTKKFLAYLKQGVLPEWEVPNMLAKYFTTISAYEMAMKN